jgi:hypothetical protein
MHGAGGPPVYSWLQRLRDNAVAFGMADGGKGFFAALESEVVYDSPEINGFISQTFTGFPDSYDFNGGGSFYDTGVVANHTLNLQFRGTSARLWYMTRGSAGEFTYTLDGAAPVLVSAYADVAQIPQFVYLSGLTSGTHTLTVTNRGGRTALPPSGVVGSSATGSVPAGTYYYVATYVFGGGETLKSNEVALTFASSQNATITVPEVGQDSVRVYRGTVSGGPYDFVTSTRTGGSSSVGFYVDDNSGFDNTRHPPISGTTNLNTSAKACWIGLSGMNDVGYTNQKFALTGQTLDTFNVSWRWWAALGLTYTGSAPTNPASYAIDTGPAAAGRVAPTLAMLELGFNDLTSNPTNAPDEAIAAIEALAAACQVAGCAGLVCSGQLPYNTNWPTHGNDLFTAMRDAAVDNGLAWVDLFSAIGLGRSVDYTGPDANPHLPKSQYVAQADWLWDNLLGAT